MKLQLTIFLIVLLWVPQTGMAQQAVAPEILLADSSSNKGPSPWKKFLGKIKEVDQRVINKVKRVKQCRKQCLIKKKKNKCDLPEDANKEVDAKCFKKGCLTKCMEKM